MTRLLRPRQRKMKVLVDADIILEFFINRGEFVEEAEDLLTRIGIAQQIEAYITNKCLNRIYLELGTQDITLGEQAIAQIESLFCDHVIEIDSTIREKARTSSLRDFDSAEEVCCAISMNLDAIVTQNPQNFIGAPLPIWTVVDLRARLLLEKDLAAEALRPRKYQYFDWLDWSAPYPQEGFAEAFRQMSRFLFESADFHILFFDGFDQGKIELVDGKPPYFQGSFVSHSFIRLIQPEVDIRCWYGWTLKEIIDLNNDDAAIILFSSKEISSNDDESEVP
jgi:hypothetical protein